MAHQQARIDLHLPAVSVDEASELLESARQQDVEAFARELDEMFARKLDEMSTAALGRIDVRANDPRPRAGRPRGEDPAITIQTEPTAAASRAIALASALDAGEPWVPTRTQRQRGRAALLKILQRDDQLSVQDFARLAGKSRQQVYKDIQARRLLALRLGDRLQRLPDWQLDPLALALTRELLARAPTLDPWTLYLALTHPLEALGGHTPLAALRPGQLAHVADAVSASLGLA